MMKSNLEVFFPFQTCFFFFVFLSSKVDDFDLANNFGSHLDDFQRDTIHNIFGAHQIMHKNIYGTTIDIHDI